MSTPVLMSILTHHNVIQQTALLFFTQSTPIDPPTLSMTFSVNDSPFAGREGTKLTSSVIQQRLKKEAETNVSLQIVQHAKGESFEVCTQAPHELPHSSATIGNIQ